MPRTLDDLNEEPIWFGWKIVMRKRKSDGVMVPTKMPVAVDGTPGSSTDPTTWGTRAEAEAAVKRFKLEGLAFALTTLPDGTRLCGLDSDRCYEEDALVGWAGHVHALLDGHLSEVSPSGAGRHHLFLIDPEALPEAAGERVDYSIGKRPDRYGFELYLTEGRYFTFTGRDVQGDLQILNAKAIVQLVNALDEFAPHVEQPLPSRPRPTGRREEDDHDKAIDILSHMPNTALFAGYLDWMKIVGSVHAATGGSDLGLRAVERWTESGNYDSAECAVLWRYFGRRHPRVNMGYLINQSRDAGYEPYVRGQRPQQRKPNGHDNDDEPIAEDYDIGLVGKRKGPIFDLLKGDVAQWVGVPAPEVPMLIDNLVPLAVAGILAGDGGAGKSLLAQVLCTAVATGYAFCGRRVDRGKAVYITGEDPESVLHNRQERINESLGYNMKALAGRIFIRAMLDNDIFLFTDGRATGLLASLVEEVEALGSVKLLVIDSAAIVYDDDEIKRRPVAKFMIALNRIARRLNATVLLITHKSRSGGSGAGTFTSGSTGWAAHARAGFDITKGEADNEVELALVKPNYTKPVPPITLYWNHHGVLTYKPDRPTDQLELAALRKTERNDDHTLIGVIDQQWKTGNGFMKQSPPRVQKIMAREPHKWNAKKTDGILSRLVENGWITYSDGGKKRGWRVTETGRAEAGLTTTSSTASATTS